MNRSSRPGPGRPHDVVPSKVGRFLVSTCPTPEPGMNSTIHMTWIKEYALLEKEQFAEGNGQPEKRNLGSVDYPIGKRSVPGPSLRRAHSLACVP